MQINNLSIVPNWRLEDIQGNNLHPQLLPLLYAVNSNSKLTRAAEDCGLSYRHAWNILREAEAFFDHPVVILERGRGAALTQLGRVLLQASQRIEGRLHTQMETLSMELNAEVHRVLADQISTLAIHASHGYAVALIPKHLSGYQAELHYHGPDDALRALNANGCKVAGFNLPMHHHVPELQQRYERLLNPDTIRVMSFIKRVQGIMVSPDCPRKITGLADLAKPDIRFINRQPRSGTRELLDHLLIDAGISTEQIHGYDNHEYTHSAVAAHVATGMAEVGFGVHAAAARFDLEFIPITEDRYFWAYRAESQSDPDIKAFIETLHLKELQNEVNQLLGYACDRAGEHLDVSELFVS